MTTTPAAAATAGMQPPTPTITTVAGTGSAGFSGDGGPATSARLRTPEGVTVDSSGTLYIAEFGNHRVRQVARDGVIITVAGTGSAGYGGDGGPATAAQLNRPCGVAVDDAGTLYITEWHHHRVRKVTPDGMITTVAGTGNSGYSGDGGPASSAHLNTPSGVAVDNAGTLYITDDFNHRVRQVTRDGVITTVAGTGSTGHRGDNGPAVAAQLNNPVGVAVDSAGALYITERDSHRIRKVTRVAEAGLPVTGAEVTSAKSDVGRMRTRSASPECRRRN